MVREPGERLALGSIWLALGPANDERIGEHSGERREGVALRVGEIALALDQQLDRCPRGLLERLG
ncbi:MAG: hypothetical protein ACREX8_13345 [Gammaproteobacteria bacterium]